MAPVRRSAAPTRPSQQRRNAAAQPSRRTREQIETEEADEEEETTPFDASAKDEEGNGFMGDEEELPEIIDLSDVQATTYEVIPRGIYEGYVDSVEYSLSQSKNLPMLTWTLKFDYEDKERTLRYYTTLAGDGAGRTKATLARLDPELDLAHLEPDAMDEHFGGLEVRIRVTVRPDRDDRRVKRNNVADIYPVDSDEFAE